MDAVNQTPVLPKGKTCRDCWHFRRCKWLLNRTGHETDCDWTPSKFLSPILGQYLLATNGQVPTPDHK